MLPGLLAALLLTLALLASARLKRPAPAPIAAAAKPAAKNNGI